MSQVARKLASFLPQTSPFAPSPNANISLHLKLEPQQTPETAALIVCAPRVLRNRGYFVGLFVPAPFPVIQHLTSRNGENEVPTAARRAGGGSGEKEGANSFTNPFSKTRVFAFGQ